MRTASTFEPMLESVITVDPYGGDQMDTTPATLTVFMMAHALFAFAIGAGIKNSKAAPMSAWNG